MKKISFSMGVGMLLVFYPDVFAQTNSCVAPPSGIVGWWPGEGSALDVIGGTSGVLSNGVAFAQGIIGQAFSFNGSNSYVEVPDSPALRATNEVTVEFWVKRQRFDNLVEYCVEKGGDWTWNQQDYGVALNRSSYNYCVSFHFAGGWRGAGRVADANWHHCAVVARNGDANPTFYIDGVPQTVAYSQGNSTMTLYPSTRPLHLGAQVDPVSGWNYFADVLLDEVSIYTRALSAEEIQAIYNAGAAGKCSSDLGLTNGLMVFYPFNGDASDASGNRNDGIVNGATLTRDRFGNANSAYLFQGNPQSKITINHTNLLLQPPFTCSAWVNWTGGTENPRFVSFAGWEIGMSWPGAIRPINFNNATAEGVVDCSSTNNFTPSVWHHVVATRSMDAMRIYVDGQLENIVLTTNSVIYPGGFGSSWISTLGGSSGIGYPYDSFAGVIDDVRIYNRALSSSEVSALHDLESAPPACVPAPLAIVGWWQGESNALDIIGSNNGTLVNSVGFAPGKVGNAFQFDGIASKIELGDPDNLKFTNSFSIEGWIWINALPSAAQLHAQIFFRGDTRYCLDPYSLCIQPNGAVRFHIEDDLGTVPCGVDLDSVPIVTQQWKHVAGVFDSDAGTMKVYVDGQLGNQTTTLVRPFRNLTGGGVAIGNHSAGYDTQPFDGLIDELSVYSKALSAAEIQSIYNAGSAGKCILQTQPPVIVSAPVNQSVAAGGTASFDVVAQGTPPLAYQWYFGTNALNGRNSSSLVLTGVQPNQAGSYFVVVSNAYGSVTSAPAILTVLTYPPLITLQPKSATVFQGGNATFTVQASGTSPLSFQWRFNGTPLAGKISSGLTLTNIQPAQEGNYSVVVTNLYGSVTSSNAVLTVLPPPVCITPPQGLVAWWRAESNTVDSVGIHDLFWKPDEGLPSVNYLYTAGKVGNAFKFPASGYLKTVAPGDSLNLGAGAGLTIEGWIRPTSYTTTQPVVEWNDGRGNVGAGLMLNPPPITALGVIGAFFTDTNRPARSVVLRSQPYVITNGTWQHVALTFDRVTGQAAIYVNGVSVAQTNLGTFIPMTQAPVYLGWHSSSAYRSFSGAMDEIGLYNRALSQAEIQSIFLADFAGKCPPAPAPCTPVPDGIVGWWRGQSNTLDSINGNNGFASNAISFTTGEVGTGFRFNGGFVRIPASSNLNVGAGPGLTVELWANPSQLIPQSFIEWNSGTGNTQGVYLAYSYNQAVLEANLIDTEGRPHLIRSPLDIITSGQWEHLAVTYDHAMGMGALYCNGICVARTNLGVFTPRTSADIYLGRSNPYYSSGFRFTGTMDEVSIYARALTDSEIGSIVMARGSGKCAAAPVIIVQPQDLVVNAGDNAVLAVEVSGTPVLHYQWYFNGNAIAGAMAPTLSLTNLQPAQSGNYSVVVTNTFGSVTSSNAVLRVNLPPTADASATASPVISCNGANAAVVLDGSRSSDPDGDVLQYLWYASGTNVIGTGAVAVVVLPVGTNSVTLMVSDGWASDQQTISVEVITTTQAIGRLIEGVGAAVSRPHPLTATLSAALASVERGNLVSAVNQLQAFQNQVSAQVAPLDATLAQRLGNAAQAIIDALSGSTCGNEHGHGQVAARIRHSRGKIHMDFPAPRGPVYIVEASSDLVHWEKIGVAADQNDGTFSFEAAVGPKEKSRFYRVVVP